MNTRFGRMERLALQAALLEGPEGRQPLLELLNEVDFENARSGIWRLSPLLHARAVAYGVNHPLVRRISGVARHIWVSNEVRMRGLPMFLDVVEPISPAVLLKGGATLTRFGALGNLRPMGDLDILLAPDRVLTAIARIRALGWRSTSVDFDVESDLPEGTPSAPFQRSTAEIFDLHWSPVHGILDPHLASTVILHAQPVAYSGRPVLVPTMHHHLAIMLLHAEQAIPNEVLRVDWACEAVLTLQAAGSTMDWHAFRAFGHSYGLDIRLADMLGEISEALGRRIGPRRASLRPMPLLRLEQRLRRTNPADLSRWGAAFLAFQQQRRGAGWRSGALLKRGALLEGVARATFAAIKPTPATPLTLAQTGRRWAEGFVGRRFLAGQRRTFAVGWSWPETTGGRWSDGSISIIVASCIEPVGTPIALRLAASPFLPRSTDALSLAVDAGWAIQCMALDGTTAAQFPVSIAARVGPDGRVVASIGFRLPERDPLHPDLRELGLFVTAFAVEPFKRHSLPLVLDLSTNSARPPELGPGWSGPELGGIWTEGGASYLSIWVEPTQARSSLTLEIDMTTPGPDPIDVNATVNGRSCAAVRLDSSIPVLYTALLAGDLGDGLLSVRFNVANPSSPASLGLSSDRRRLGFRVRRITLRRHEEAEE